jgi:alkylation response protein AidB-like acyl-CoA dehydrogenase
VPKHNGISYVLLDFSGPGVEYRPIKQMTGAAEFAEDFFDGARAPLFNVIGGLNNGWRVAMTTLGYERGSRATTGYLGFEREFWALAETARKTGRSADPLVRQQLAWAYTQVSLMKFSGLRTLARLAAGQAPGPEASIDKLFWSEYFKRLGEVAAGIEGSQTLIPPGQHLRRVERDPAEHHRRARPRPAEGAARYLADDPRERPDMTTQP